MSTIVGTGAGPGEQPFAAGGFLAYTDWLDDESGKKRPLVLFGCDELPTSVNIGGLFVDYERKIVSWRRRAVSLTTAEFRILCCLVQRLGAFVPSREIYDAVHGPGHLVGVGRDGHCNATRVHIKRIRRKFRAVDSSFDEIETWYSHGYRWRCSSA